jgi:hypothetical protein
LVRIKGLQNATARIDAASIALSGVPFRDLTKLCLNLRVRKPSTANHDTRSALYACEILERIGIEQDQIRTRAERHRAEGILRLEVLSDVCGAGLDDIVRSHAGIEHPLHFAVDGEPRNAELLGRIAAKQYRLPEHDLS